MNLNKTINFNFKNKIVLILGASGGIGRVIVKDFLKAKAFVYGISRKEIKIKNRNFKNINLDLNNIKKEFKNSKLYNLKKIDFIINAYSITEKSESNLQSEVIFEKTIKNNLISYYNLIKILENRINNKGSIVNITSINSKLAFEKNPSYQVSKAGLSSLTRSLAKDLSKKNIRVNSVAPSYIKTNMTIKSYKNNKLKNIIANKNFLKRWGEKNEISSVVLFLCSEGSSFINGQEIFVDGGWSVNGGF